MKRKFLLVLPFLCLATACATGGSKIKPITEDYKTYAFFMNNYPRATDVAPSGATERIDNSLYLRIEITPGTPFAAPEDPSRENYEFKGWHKEKECINLWDFSNDITNETVFLYAKWGQTQSEEYVEPEYIPPETIITDAEYRINGILNVPLNNDGSVDLTTGALNRLNLAPSDVKFALNYERRADVTLSASYDKTNKIITVSSNFGTIKEIQVNDVSSSYKVTENSYYEDKAVKYETKSSNVESYHIALGGSSSMENWTTSTLDMSPIVTFNHGIGGTTIDQWNDKLLRRLVLPYSPKAVVYYVGVNNIINGDKETGTVAGNKLVTLFNTTHQYLPNAQIFYVLINKLPGYLNRQDDFDTANNKALEYESNHNYLTCIDAGKGLLKEDGSPNAAYFLTDGLHMSKYGYVIWGQAVKDAIIEWLGK